MRVFLLVLAVTISALKPILAQKSKSKSLPLKVDENGHLDLRGKKLKTIPLEVFLLENIKSLDVSKNKLTQLPDDIKNLKNLEILNLSGNKILELPDALCQLQNLKELIIFKNELDKLPACFNQLTNLEKLDAWNNYFFSVAPQLVGLTKLKFVELRVNPISMEEQEFLELEFPNTKFQFTNDCNCR